LPVRQRRFLQDVHSVPISVTSVELVRPSHKEQPTKGTDFVTTPKSSRKSTPSPILNVNELTSHSATAACLCDTGLQDFNWQILPVVCVAMTTFQKFMWMVDQDQAPRGVQFGLSPGTSWTCRTDPHPDKAADVRVLLVSRPAFPPGDFVPAMTVWEARQLRVCNGAGDRRPVTRTKAPHAIMTMNSDPARLGNRGATGPPSPS
jgi:hypothetical protein